MNAVAILTEVSLTLHFSGLGGEVIIFEPPGRSVKSLVVAAAACCFARAKRDKADSFSFSSCCSIAGDFGGDLEPRAGALCSLTIRKVDEKKKQTRTSKRTGPGIRWKGVCREMSCDPNVCLAQEACQQMTLEKKTKTKQKLCDHYCVVLYLY